jgi:hypothetical protein
VGAAIAARLAEKVERLRLMGGDEALERLTFYAHICARPVGFPLKKP